MKNDVFIRECQHYDFSQYQDNDIAGRDEEAEEGRGDGKVGGTSVLSSQHGGQEISSIFDETQGGDLSRSHPVKEIRPVVTKLGKYKAEGMVRI